MIDELLEIGPHVTALPVVHGSGDFAWEVRRLMMKHSYDCLAVALPPSFQRATEEAILQLPTPSIVIQRDQKYLTPTSFSPVNEFAEEGEELDDSSLDPDREPGVSFVPVDPCQSMIAAIRTAMGDRVERRFIDLETSRYEPHARVMPDAFALKRMSLESMRRPFCRLLNRAKVPNGKHVLSIWRGNYASFRSILKKSCLSPASSTGHGSGRRSWTSN